MNELRNPTTELSRDFFLVTYLDENTIRQTLKAMSVAHWAFIRHDKDDKEPHTHILLRMNNKTTAQSVKKKFIKAGTGLDNGKDVNTMVEYAQDTEYCFEYLTHANAKEKYQYPITDVVTDDLGYWRGDYSSFGKQKTAERSIENTAYQILSDLENKVSLREMARRYGREFIINRRSYVEYYELMAEEERYKKDLERLKIQAMLTTGNIAINPFQQWIDENGELHNNQGE